MCLFGRSPAKLLAMGHSADESTEDMAIRNAKDLLSSMRAVNGGALTQIERDESGRPCSCSLACHPHTCM